MRALVFAALALGVVALLTVAFWNYTQDDVFITYVYSRNIAEGKGFVFNPGERVQGTTTPLYALVMAGVYRLTPDLLHAGNLLSALFLVIACGIAVSLTRPYLSTYGRAAIAITLVASPLVYVSFGMETLLYSAVLVLAFWLSARRRPRAALLMAAALTWIRADGIVLAAALWLPAAWQSWRARALDYRRGIVWQTGLAYLAAIAPWFLFAWAYFGAPLPNTFNAKQQIFGGLSFLSDGVRWWQSLYGSNPFAPIAIPLIGLGAWRAAAQPGLRPLALWTALYAAGYTILNVTTFWYYTPLLTALIILAALGGEWLARALIRLGAPRLIVIVGSLFLVFVSGGMAIVRAGDFAVPPPRVTTYRLLGEWIERNTDDDATILVGDLGIVGYHARRRTIDSPGLITPDMYFKRDDYAVAKYKPDFVVATQYWTWQQVTAQEWFHYHYVPLVQLSTPGDDFSPMVVFQRRLPVEPPQQVYQGLELPLSCLVTLETNSRLPEEIRARLLSSHGDTLFESAHPFLWGRYPAARAPAPETLIDQIALPMSVPPGTYIWEIACDTTQRGAVEVLPIDQVPSYVALESAEWQTFARLRGAALPQGGEVWSGGSLMAALDWRALGSAERDYSVYLHLLDSAGRLVAQDDGYPRDGLRPTTSWQPGEVIVDIRRIQLPPDLPAGEYTLSIGWYDWQTGERLPQVDGGDSLRLPFVIRNRWPGGSGWPGVEQAAVLE